MLDLLLLLLHAQLPTLPRNIEGHEIVLFAAVDFFDNAACIGGFRLHDDGSIISRDVGSIRQIVRFSHSLVCEPLAFVAVV